MNNPQNPQDSPKGTSLFYSRSVHKQSIGQEKPFQGLWTPSD